MMPVLKPEANDTWLSVKIPSSLDEKIRTFAEQNDVSRHRAAHYILSLFFSGDWKKIPVSVNSERGADRD